MTRRTDRYRSPPEGCDAIGFGWLTGLEPSLPWRHIAFSRREGKEPGIAYHRPRARQSREQTMHMRAPALPRFRGARPRRSPLRGCLSSMPSDIWLVSDDRQPIRGNRGLREGLAYARIRDG
jgi:hypothetical protein